MGDQVVEGWAVKSVASLLVRARFLGSNLRGWIGSNSTVQYKQGPMANTTHSSPPEKRPFIRMKKILNARNTLFHIHNVWINRQE
jgi:hypothetical protein